jgi:hypothetical protein
MTNSNFNSITFATAPKIVIIANLPKAPGGTVNYSNGDWHIFPFWVGSSTYMLQSSSGSNTQKFWVEGTTLKWFCNAASSNADEFKQLNASSNTYQWIALG